MFRVKIETGNAAFADGSRGHEIARILRRLADDLEGSGAVWGLDVGLRDANGHTVGKATVRKDR